MTETLDKRLAAVAVRVRQGSRVADIGTDHAYLPVALVQRGCCPSAIAADLRTGPAERARQTIREAGLQERIEVRLGDGLAPVQPEEVDDIVIAGMGGETIAAILEAAPWTQNERYQLVLQPMSKPEVLRRFLMTHGFSIVHEQPVEEPPRWYTVLTAVFTAAPPEEEEAAWYIGAIPAGQGGAYLEKQRQRLEKRAQGLAHTQPDAPEIARLRAISARIQAHLEKGEHS